MIDLLRPGLNWSLTIEYIRAFKYISNIAVQVDWFKVIKVINNEIF